MMMKSIHLSRRHFIRSSGALALSIGAGLSTHLSTGWAYEPPVLNEDGLYQQPWFLDSFLELADDVSTASDSGKHLAVMWELKGCPYCKETHMVNFARDDIREFIIANFDVLQLNVIGSRIVTDFDGEQLSEKDLAAKYGVRFTPTFQFFPKVVDGLADKAPKTREVSRLPGYMKPDHFFAMFQYVAEEAYHQENLKDYLQRKTG